MVFCCSSFLPLRYRITNCSTWNHAFRPLHWRNCANCASIWTLGWEADAKELSFFKIGKFWLQSPKTIYQSILLRHVPFWVIDKIACGRKTGSSIHWSRSGCRLQLVAQKTKKIKKMISFGIPRIGCVFNVIDFYCGACELNWKALLRIKVNNCTDALRAFVQLSNVRMSRCKWMKRIDTSHFTEHLAIII